MKDVLEQLKVALSKLTSTEVKLEADKLADSGITIEAEAFAVGEAVFTVNEEGERISLPEGTYTTEAGVTFSVDESGVITSLGEETTEEEAAEEAAEAPAEEAPAMSGDASATPAAPKKVVESVSKETFFSAEQVGELVPLVAAEIVALLSAEAEVTEETPTADAVEDAPEATSTEEATPVEAKENEVELSAQPSEEPKAVAPKSKTAKTLLRRSKEWKEMSVTERIWAQINS